MDATPADPDLAAPIPSVEIDVDVPCYPARAFDYFTRDIERWWPLSTHSCAKEAAASVAFEPRAGGRLLETASDGTEHPWGTVTAWEPGRRLVFSWHPGRDPSTAQWIEVAFRQNPAGTRVTLVHGGWEALGERAEAIREGYTHGWQSVVGGRYRDFCVAARAA
jgi:uncharacterized protein YndB with AHSA1/START domain